ncbi:MAG TPA: radical SAM family heme chaperone HemW [Anaerolineae bacterium]|nr:radical SAM family heme chaperone HemW [Anaerolineae bacterium]
MSLDRLGIYVHIPFCRRKCAYCDFNSYAGLDHLFTAYTKALVTEITAAGMLGGYPRVDSIYLGGGTPTVLPPSLLGEILSACGRSFNVSPDAEVTCEANPGLLDRKRSDSLLTIGVNRLSLGVQSFDDAELRLLGRIHTARQAEQALRSARDAGFTNISMDLLFGLPGQGATTWPTSLQRAIELGPEHLSLYSLAVENGTSLARQVAAGQVQPPDEDVAADLYLHACDRLRAAGYVHYEISNWAQGVPASDHDPPSMACRHNLLYWRNGTYLGFGAGAHSSLAGRRWWNVSAPDEYIRRAEAERSLEAGSEEIDERLAMGETMMLGLRLLREGVADTTFEERYDRSLVSMFGQEIADLEKVGLLDRLPDRVRLSARGRLLGNQAFAQFLPS